MCWGKIDLKHVVRGKPRRNFELCPDSIIIRVVIDGCFLDYYQLRIRYIYAVLCLSNRRKFDIV